MFSWTEAVTYFIVQTLSRHDFNKVLQWKASFDNFIIVTSWHKKNMFAQRQHIIQKLGFTKVQWQWYNNNDL